MAAICQPRKSRNHLANRNFAFLETLRESILTIHLSKIERFGSVHILAAIKYDVNMIFNSANLNSRAIMFSSDSANVSPNTIFNFYINPIFTIFRAKNDMIKDYEYVFAIFLFIRR